MFGVHTDGLRVLIKMLNATVDHVVFCSITSIHNILIKLEIKDVEGNPTSNAPIFAKFRDINGPSIVSQKISERVLKTRVDQNQPVDPKLIQNMAKFVIICVDCLRCVSFKCSRTKKVLLHEHVPEILVELLQRPVAYPTNGKLGLYITRLLKVLSVCQYNKPRIVECGGISAIGHVIKNALTDSKNSSKILIHALLTLRNLSDEANRQPKQATNHDVLEALIQLARTENDSVRAMSVGILYNLVCNNCYNKAFVIQSLNGVDIILQLTRQIIQEGKKTSTDLLELSVSTLKILTNDMTKSPQDPARRAQAQIRSTKERFDVVYNLFCLRHEFFDNEKIIHDTLVLLCNVFESGGFEEPTVSAQLQSIMERTFALSQMTRTHSPLVRNYIS